MQKSKMRKCKKGEIAKMILKGLAIGGVMVAVVALPGMAPILNLFNSDDKRGKQKIKHSLYQLKKKKFVKMYYKDNKEVIEITEKGKKRLLQYDFEELNIDKPKKWDGFWRIVIFDIPENRRQARNAIVLKLKELGFILLQKSVFIFPYKCKDEIDFIGEHFFVRKHINYMIVKSLENERKLKNKFNLI